MTHLLLLLCLSRSAVMHPSFRLAEKMALRQGGGTPRPLTQEHSSTSPTPASSPELTARMLSIFPPRAVTPPWPSTPSASLQGLVRYRTLMCG